MKKEIIQINVHLPEHIREVFSLLKSSGAEHMALFGGALRDADYAFIHQVSKNIKDFDLRIWIDPAHEQDFLTKLRDQSGSEIVKTASPGTNRIRYVMNYMGIELDISLRAIPKDFQGKPIPVEAVAQERAGDSDIGLSSVALDPEFNAWATPEYTADLQDKTLTVYPSDNQKRSDEYTTRMQYKFPSHAILYLPNDNQVNYRAGARK